HRAAGPGRPLSSSLRFHQVGAPELLVGDRPPFPAMAFHHPVARSRGGPALHRPEHEVLAHLPRVVGAGAAPAFAVEWLMAGQKLGIAHRALVAAIIDDPPVPGVAAKVI